MEELIMCSVQFDSNNNDSSVVRHGKY